MITDALGFSSRPRGLAIRVLALFVLVTCADLHADRLLIPMDITQSNHLKAYGVAFWALEHGVTVFEERRAPAIVEGPDPVPWGLHRRVRRRRRLRS